MKPKVWTVNWIKLMLDYILYLFIVFEEYSRYQDSIDWTHLMQFVMCKDYHQDGHWLNLSPGVFSQRLNTSSASGLCLHESVWRKPHHSGTESSHSVGVSQGATLLIVVQLHRHLAPSLFLIFLLIVGKNFLHQNDVQFDFGIGHVSFFFQ